MRRMLVSFVLLTAICVPVPVGASPPLSFAPAPGSPLLSGTAGDIAAAGYTATVGDFNNDGKPDLLVVSQGFGISSNGRVSVLLGNGDGTFRTAPGDVTIIGGLAPPESVLVTGDFNGDGKGDLIANQVGGLAVLLGNGDGTFRPAPGSPYAGDDSSGLFVADVNGDGKPDIVAAGYVPRGGVEVLAVSVLLGNGDGSFHAAPGPPRIVNGTNRLPRVGALVDFNGDGTPDLTVVDADGLTILLGNGDGTFAPPGPPIESGVDVDVLAAGDFNGDSKVDLVVENHYNVGGGPGGQRADLSVLLNTTGSQAAPNPFAPIFPFADSPAHHFFRETSHSLSYGFKTFWEQSGGLPVFGYPLSEEFTEQNADTGQAYTVQYLERQRFEYHPENKGTPYETLLGRLGMAEAQQRNLLSTAPFQPIAPTNAPTCRSFPETGHQVCASFREYWQTHGLEFGDPGVSYRESLALFGYPISETFTQDGLTVQYFERAVFEYHPENADTDRVLLRRLGAQVAHQRGSPG